VLIFARSWTRKGRRLSPRTLDRSETARLVQSSGPVKSAARRDGDAYERTAEGSGLTVVRFSQVLRAVLEDRLRPLELTAPQYLALRLIQQSPGLTNAELARELFVTPQTTIRVVRRLTQAGLVVRTPDPRHGRLLETRLTTKGIGFLARARRLAEAAETEVLAPLTAGQRSRLLTFLQRCTPTPASWDRSP
jgi:DNA-binding MarR family transcriptional regulator